MHVSKSPRAEGCEAEDREQSRVILHIQAQSLNDSQFGRAGSM